MKLKSFLQWNIFTSSLMLLVETYFRKDRKPHFVKRTSYEIITGLHDDFKNRVNHPDIYRPPMEPVEVIRISSGVINAKLDKSDRYLLAILNLTPGPKYKLNIHFESDDLNIPKPPNIQHQPLGLRDFPYLIKMEKSHLLRLFGETQAKCYLFYPCIESDWPDGGNPNADRKVHFTVAVLGSDQQDCHKVHPGHLGKSLLQAIDGEETWPYDNFSWYGD
jgi:hypothetical protein